MKRMMKKMMAEIWYHANFRRDVLARIANLDARLAALESRPNAKKEAMTISTGAQ